MKRYFSLIKNKGTGGKWSKTALTAGRRTLKARRRLGPRPVRSTTLARKPDGPFPRFLKTTLVYENQLAVMTGSSAFLNKSFKLNSAYDFDNNGDFGDKQPLYYDTLCTASGPYRQYKVKSWKTTFTVVNMTALPITVFLAPPTAGTSEIDSAAEADNFPGVIRLYLSASVGSANIGTISNNGDVKDVYDSFRDDQGFIGAYNSDPTYIIYGSLSLASADGSTAVSAYVSVRHEMEVELSQIDAIVS